MLRFSIPKTLFWLLIIFLLVMGPLAVPVGASGLAQAPVNGDDMPTWVLLPLIAGSLLGVHSLSRRRS